MLIDKIEYKVYWWSIRITSEYWVAALTFCLDVEGEGEHEGVSLATIIANSSRLRTWSDGFD